MKQTLLMVLVFLGGCLACQRIYSQQYTVVGTDICSDGTRTTHIGLSDSDPAKFYALYHDGEFLAVKRMNTKKTPNTLDFGSFSDAGKYTVVEFAKANPDFEKPESGKRINGSVSINAVPVLSVSKKLEVSSGNPLKYMPQANTPGCTYKWTTRLDAGKAKGFRERGEGMITDTIFVQGNQPACVVYLITPFSPEQLGSCMGKSQELVVWIKP